MGQLDLGGQTFEVYGDLDGANSYFLGSLNKTGWSAASSGDKSRALVTATRMFERTSWVGSPTEPIDKTQPQPTDTQPLQWPRVGAIDCNGVTVPDTVFPDELLAGAYELANALLEDPDDTIETTPNSGSNLRRELLREKVDVLETETDKEYFQPTLNTATRFPTEVHEYIRCFLSSSQGASSVAATGLCDDSAFDDDFGFNPYGLP